MIYKTHEQNAGEGARENLPDAASWGSIEIVAQLNEAVFQVDADCRITFLNPAWTRLSGHPVGPALGRAIWDFLHVEDQGKLKDGLAEAVSNRKEVFKMRARLMTQGGTSRWVCLSTRLKNADQGRFEGLTGTVDDISEILVAEQALNWAKEQAEGANRAKSQFLASMSHEMRTPMHAIIGLTDVVLGTAIGADQAKQLKMVKASAGSLLEIIDEVLLHAKLESGEVKLQREKFDLREVMGQALAPLLFRAMENHLELNWRVNSDLPPVVIGDPHRLKQVLHHLVGNAIKFTHEGAVTVDVAFPTGPTDQPDPSLGRGVMLQFSVKDTGIGISEEQRKHLFEAFSQADGEHDRRYGGTGLGLAVSSRLVELMKGRVWLESEVGKGSCFHVTAWFGLPDLPPARTPDSVEGNPAQGKRSCSILVAEDNTVNQHLIRHLVTKLGHKPSIVANGRLCVEAWEKGGYDAILMDVQMPEMSGIEATIAIRERERTKGGHIPIIAVTANAVLGDRETCLKSGMDEYITKPIRNQLLESALDRFLHVSEAPVPKVAVASQFLMDFDAALSGADDDLDLLRSLMEMFLTRTPDCLGKIEKAFAANDCAEVMMQAHSLKGALRMLSTPVVEDFAFKVERASRAKNLEEARSSFVLLIPKVNQLYEEIRGHLKERAANK